ncbi:MAG: hypothetical protein CMM76_14625 [Rhodospirillaceae bacterium]|nr:hypothetical protein [Rhodospirillaceae bacterium]|tara:strand:- start:494 stop:847 length:354 start_codon:yes stop_codon:yes gene_type:complete
MALWMPQWPYPTKIENPKKTRKGPDFYAKQQKKIDAGLATMEKDLSDEEFCYGNTFTLVDIACGCALVCVDIRLPKMDWRKNFPALALHLARMAKRHSFCILSGIRDPAVQARLQKS